MLFDMEYIANRYGNSIDECDDNKTKSCILFNKMNSDAIMYGDMNATRAFFKAFKQSSNSTIQTKYISSLFLKYPSLMKKVIFVSEPGFVTIPHIYVTIELRGGSEIIDKLGLVLEIEDSVVYMNTVEFNLRETLMYLRDNFDYIPIATPLIFTSSQDITNWIDVNNSFLI